MHECYLMPQENVHLNRINKYRCTRIAHTNRNRSCLQSVVLLNWICVGAAKSLSFYQRQSVNFPCLYLYAYQVSVTLITTMKKNVFVATRFIYTILQRFGYSFYLTLSFSYHNILWWDRFFSTFNTNFTSFFVHFQFQGAKEKKLKRKMVPD